MRFRSRIEEGFYEPLWIEGGAQSRGVIQRSSDAETPALDFSNPRLICRVRYDSLLQVGQVVRRQGGERFLLAEHSRTPHHRTFWMFTTHRQATWKRMGTTTDALTGLAKASTLADVASPAGIWVGWEAITREAFDRDMRVREELVRVITGENVQLGDRIGDQTVKRIQPVLGINLVTVQ